MGIAKTSAACVLIALLAGSAVAGGFQISAVGTQASAMAGAFRAVADDWTAAYYNPAGYAYLYDNELGANAAFLHYRHSVVPDYRYGDIYESGVFNDQENVNKHEIFSNPSGGAVVKLPVWGETTFGLSAFQPFDYNIRWTLYDLPMAYNDSLRFPVDHYGNNLDVVAFQLTMGREFIEDQLAVGVGLQLLRADLKYSSVIFHDNLFGPPVGVRPWDKVTEYNQNDGNGWGIGLNAGMLYKINDKMKLAVTAQIPSSITIEGRAYNEFYLPLNRTLLNNTDSAGLAQGTPGYLFISGAKVTDSADFETTLDLPPSIAAGVSYEVNDKLTLSLDATYTFWSKFEGFSFNFSNHQGLTGTADTATAVQAYFTQDLKYPVTWDNAGSVAVGFRYYHRDYLTILGGGSMDQSPARNSNEITPLFVDTGDKWTIAGGLIFHYRQWDFGLSTSYTDLPELASDQLYDTNGDGISDSFEGTYQGSTYETVLSFKYRF